MHETVGQPRVSFVTGTGECLHGLANSIRNNLHKQPEPWSQCPLRQESLTRTRAASQGHRRRSRRSLRRLADTAIHPYRPARRPSLDPAAVAPAGRPVRPPDTSPSPGGPSAERQPPAGRGPPGHGGAHRGPAGALWCGTRHPGPKAAIHTHAHAQAATLLVYNPNWYNVGEYVIPVRVVCADYPNWYNGIHRNTHNRNRRGKRTASAVLSNALATAHRRPPITQHGPTPRRRAPH